VKINHRRKLTEIEKLQRMLAVSDLYYLRDLNYKEIAATLGCSETHVSRILKAAAAEKIIEIRINQSHTDKLRQRLMVRFPRLVDVRLTPYLDDYEATRTLLGQEAAKYFDDVVSKDETSVGLSGGRTLHRVIEAVSPRPRKLKIYPLIGIWRELQINFIDAGALVHSLWVKCLEAADAFWFPIQPINSRASEDEILAQRSEYMNNPEIKKVFRAASNVDLALIGVGPLRKRSSTIKQLQNIDITYDYLKKKGAIGIAAGVWFDKNAKPILPDYFLSVSLESFQRMTKKSGKKAVIVAGGDEKIEAIRVLLENEVCNVLLTDMRTAQQLIK
jgi:DNA-binding transcriptional regulator LsrR (DeoR family)